MKKVTCKYGLSCQVSVEKLDNQHVLKLDFNIKEYKICIIGQGWQDYMFPENIVINDKLYLDSDTKDKLLEIFDHFIETQYLHLPDAKQNARGFSYLDLTDIKGNPISIQASSAAMESCIWFGAQIKDICVDEGGQLVPYKFPAGDPLVSGRMHLNISKVKQLRNAIVTEWDKFLEKEANPKQKNKMS